MSNAKQTLDWRELREFSGVDLSQSFVLSWHAESELFMVDLDLHLTETHPHYEKPRPAEKVCIRPAMMEFPYCDEVTVDGKTASSIAKAAEQLRHGAIKELRRLPDSRYEITGDFGTVLIVGERPLLRLKGR